MIEMGSQPLMSMSNLGNTSISEIPDLAKSPLKLRLIEHYFTETGITRKAWCPLSEYVVTFDKRFMWNTVYERCIDIEYFTGLWKWNWLYTFTITYKNKDQNG